LEVVKSIRETEGIELPVICQMTFAQDGRTLLGYSPARAAHELYRAGADVLGVNCSTGPSQISTILPAYGLLRDSGRVFMEAAPRGLDPEQIGRTLASEPGVIEVHDLHVWEVTTSMPAISAHIIVAPEADCHQARFRASALLAERFGIEHSTLQVEHKHDQDQLLEIEPSP
jgi:hypothetical protein